MASKTIHDIKIGDGHPPARNSVAVVVNAVLAITYFTLFALGMGLIDPGAPSGAVHGAPTSQAAR